MRKALKKIPVRTLHHARPFEGEVDYENNGLALVKLVEYGNQWRCVHLSTGWPISPNGTSGVVLSRKRDMKAFVDYLAPLFPWNTWTDKEQRPDWAGAAAKKVSEFILPERN